MQELKALRHKEGKLQVESAESRTGSWSAELQPWQRFTLSHKNHPEWRDIVALSVSSKWSFFSRKELSEVQHQVWKLKHAKVITRSTGLFQCESDSCSPGSGRTGRTVALCKGFTRNLPRKHITTYFMIFATHNAFCHTIPYRCEILHFQGVSSVKCPAGRVADTTKRFPDQPSKSV